ncbi:MAG TPA: 5-formyltetrahydrofolate cyclo-ligase [bacterium]|jgi:5-formyltetrahydrofolate cyclo-ligase|nr:5-formyltetrahydrofolate cyclo-ligase [bacterium]
MADTIEKIKSVYRQNMKDQKALVTPEAAEIAAHSIWNQLKEESFFKKAKRIAAFCSVGNEISTKLILEGVLSSGKELYLPKTDKGQTLVQFIGVKDLTKLVTGPFEILEPSAGTALPPDQIDLILVPGLAFDARGHRLGYGQGYYDRYLPLLRPGCFTLGIAYSFQIIDKMPNAEHDIPVNAVLTDKYILLC